MPSAQISAAKISAAQVSANMGPREWAMLVALSILWGGSFFFVEVAIGELPPFTIVTLRVALAALTLWAVVLATGRKIPRARSIWMAFFGMGLLNNAIPFSLIVWGQTQIASGFASILNATTPMFTVLVAGLLLSDERPTPAKLVGVIIGFAGAVVMIGPGILTGFDARILAPLAVLVAALSYAFAGVFGRRFKTLGVDPVITAAGQVTASAIMLTPVMLVVDQPWTLAMPGPVTLASLAGLAVLSTGLAYILYFRILASSGATNLMLVTFLIPVSAILLGALILDERLAPIQFAGMALIGLGLIAIDGRMVRGRRH